MNFLDIVNEVLVRLRDDEVTTITANSHSKQICAYVNEGKRRVESAMKWSALLHSSSFSTAASTATYSLTDWRDRASIDFIFNTTNKDELMSTSYYYIKTQNNATNAQEARPHYWTVNGQDANGDPTIELYPTPDAVYTIEVHGYRPQDDLNGDNDLVLVPEWPVLLQAYALAVSERGEDGGNTANEAAMAAREALAEAIAHEEGNLMEGTAHDWEVIRGARA